MRAYLATHFFNEAGLLWTDLIAQTIENKSSVSLYVPHRNKDINDKKNNDDNITDVKVYEADMSEMLKSNILIANLDGVEIDAGVATEVGWFAGFIDAHALSGVPDKPRMIIGIYTDMRQDGTGDNHLYRNLMVTGACRKYGVIVRTVDEVVEEINKFVSTYGVANG